MRMSLISCPFKTSFGWYASSLKAAVEARSGGTIQWVASNCGCGDPMEAGRRFQAQQCAYFDMPMPSDFRSAKTWRRRLRGAARSAIVYVRARRYANMLDHPEVVHFQQVLNAYGSKAVFSWLKLPSKAARVVTVHELDADQLEYPELNETYNRADAIIVLFEELRQYLIRLKVRPEKIHVVLHGTSMPPREQTNSREGVVFYGGHKLMSGKGVDTAFKAMAIVRQRISAPMPTLKVHGHYGLGTPPEALRLAKENGMVDGIVWLNQIPDEEIMKVYQRSLVCVLPYTRSFAGLPAALAAACQLPVVCTRKAGLPDHLGDAGIWVDENNPEQLADRIIGLLGDEHLREEVGARLLKRAQESLCWEVIAGQTLRVYEEALRSKAQAN
ncbi:MAG: glycosyltransferase family 4 protein [Terriglobales bacterium]